MRIIKAAAICTMAILVAGVAISAFAGEPPTTTELNSNSKSNAVAVSNSYPEQTSNVVNNNDSNSNAGAVGIGVNGPIENHQAMVFAPHYEAAKRTLIPPSVSGMAASGNLFFNTGSINSGVAGLQMSFLDFCSTKVRVAARNDPRFKRIVSRGVDGIDLAFQPFAGYVEAAPPALASSISVQTTEVRTDLPYYQKYVCLGAILMVTEEDKQKAELTDVLALTSRAQDFVAQNLSGFSDVILLTAKAGVAFEGEVEGKGGGFSATPQATGVLGGIGALLGISAGFSHTSTSAGMYARTGMVMLVVARAPDHACDCYAVMQTPPPKEKETQSAPKKTDEQNAQKVILEIRVPNN